MVIIVMGVSGCGKSTVGGRLAEELGWAFYDADDFHNEANREKMSRGIPLADEDRAAWLAALRGIIQENEPCVLACSALKERYRAILRVNERVKFVYLKGSYAEIEARMRSRAGHFMPVQLLKSQFEALEEPTDALTVRINQPLKDILQFIRKGLAL